MNIYHETQVPWPATRRRTAKRKYGVFKRAGCLVTLSEAAERVETAVKAFPRTGKNWRTAELWIYAEGQLGARKQFLANSKWKDPGVVVSFDLDGHGYAIPCDAFTDPAQNLAAIAATTEGMRANERYGVTTISEMLQSYAALPSRISWSDALGNPESLAEAETNYRRLAKAAHPDHGGSHDQMAALNAAINEAREVLS